MVCVVFGMDKSPVKPPLWKAYWPMFNKPSGNTRLLVALELFLKA